MESRRSGKAEASSSHSEYGETRPLNLGCRIFISHSGRNKDFVRHLHDKLVNQLYYDDGTVFFDEKSLPTAEPISMTNIVAEARGCELGVLVLTEDFFMHSPNPMLELETLTASKVRLLPLFFKMSVDEFKKMRRNNVWEDQWKAWLKEGEDRLRVWKHAVSFVDRYSGLEYCKLANNDLEFIRKVVAEVARIVRPISPFSEDGVWGMDRICELVNDMYKQCALNRVSDNGTQIASTSTSAGRREADNGNSHDLVGVYGFAGLGKSTLCRCLCNYYFAEFHGKVCCLDLGSIPDSSQASSQTYPSGNPFMWRMQYLLSKLTGHIDHVHSLTFFEIQNRLGKLITKKPIFLAIDNIDNIWSDLKFLEEVDFYLSCNFAKGSKVFITARSENILERVIREYIRFSTMIEHIPKLKFEEARGIFVQKNPKILQMSNMEDEVKECVSMCIIHSDNHPHHQREVDDEWYHPLMLKSSAASIRYDRRRNVDLKLRLREFIQSATAIDKSDARKAVFALLDITYAILSDEAKKVLLDLSLAYKVNARELRVYSSLCTWIQCLYSHVDMKKLENIFSSLEDLSFIDIVEFDHYDGPVLKFIRMHDLMVDFSMYKAMQGAGAAGFTPHYLVLENDAQVRNQAAFRFLLSGALTRNEWPSVSALPKSIRTVSMSDLCSSDLEQLDLRSLQGVEVLHLVDNPGVQEVLLSRTTLAHLRSLIIVLNHRVHGCLRLTIDEDWPTPPTASSQIPMGGKLAWVELRGNVILSTCRKSRPWWSGGEQSLLQRLGISRSTTAPHAVCGLGILQSLFCNLQYLALSHFPATRSIDLTTCTTLKGLHLRDMSGLRDIHGLETLINLDELKILCCDELLLLSIPANPRLSAIVIDCSSLKRISLLRTSYPEADRSACASHGGFHVTDCPALRKVDGIVQYTGYCCFSETEGIQELIQDLLKPFETDASKFKANVKSLRLARYRVPGLARLTEVIVEDAQHVGLLISALVKAQPTDDLHRLELSCKKDGDCGCDINEPHFGPGIFFPRSWSAFIYRCPRVRNLASLPLLGGVTHLSLKGCRNIEVWPDFAIMTSLKDLDLSFTSLKEWPISTAQLLQLSTLDIEGCWQLPTEEMIKAMIKCKSHAGCHSAWGRSSLAGLLDDLRAHRRDRGSVADALDSRWPELVVLFHEQWRYLRYPYPYPVLYSSYPITRCGDLTPGRELCYLIRLMYELWFAAECEAEAGSTCACADSIPTAKEKMKRLLCTEIFMALPFYVWRIGRTRLHAVDEWEEYPWPEGYESYMAFALVGSASIGCFNASLNDDLKDRMVNFVQSFAEAQSQHAAKDSYYATPVRKCNSREWPHFSKAMQLTKVAHERLTMRVGDAICKMARAPSVAAALGQDFMQITMDGLEARYIEKQISRETCEGFVRWLNRTSYWSYSDSDLEISREACENFSKWIILGGKPSVAALKGLEASTHDDSLGVRVNMDDNEMGVRVLHKIMPKILSHSVLNFGGLWTAILENKSERESSYRLLDVSYPFKRVSATNNEQYLE